MSLKSPTTLTADAATAVNDNTSGDVVPADVRGILNDLTDSNYNRITEKAVYHVRVVAPANCVIATGLENGDTLDGATLATGDWVLLPNQSAPAENGIYQVVASGAASRIARLTTYDLHVGIIVLVYAGTLGIGTIYQGTSVPGGTLNSTALAFTPFFATTAEAETGTAVNKAVTPAGLKAAIIGKNSVNLLTAGMVKRTTNGATPYQFEEGATNDTMVAGYEFSLSVAQAIQIAFPLPPSYDQSVGLTFKIYGLPSATAGTGNVHWQVRAKWVRDDDTVDGSWGTAVGITDSFIADQDQHISSESGACTPGGTFAAECMLYVEIFRDPANGSDTYTQSFVMQAAMMKMTTKNMTDD